MNNFEGMEDVGMCDGCGEIKRLFFVSEFGSVFCQECIDRNKVKEGVKMDKENKKIKINYILPFGILITILALLGIYINVTSFPPIWFLGFIIFFIFLMLFISIKFGIR